MARIVRGGLIQAANPIPDGPTTQMIMELAREALKLRQFHRDRRPDMYAPLTYA